MPRRYINLSEVTSIRNIYKFGDILVPDTGQIYYDTILTFLSMINNKNIIIPKSSIENEDILNYNKLVNFMKDYPDIYTNEMINGVQEIIKNHILDVDISTAVKLTKENKFKYKFYLILRDARNEPRVLTRPSFFMICWQ